MKRNQSAALSGVRNAAAHGIPGSRSFRFLVTVLIALAAALAAPRSVQAQLSAQPVILELRTPAGSSTTSSFGVRNEGDETIQLDLYAVDFDQPTEGGHTFADLGSHAHSCAGRLSFYPSNVALEPGEVTEVEIRMAPAETTCWSIVFAQTAGRASSGIRIAQRIGVKVYGVSTGSAPAGEIADVRVDRDPASGVYVAHVNFENVGEGPVRPEGELEIRTLTGDVVGVVDVVAFSVLPGRIRRASVPVDVVLPPGEYLAIPILDFGGEYLAGGQTQFRVEDR